jgi:hypothetical protein
MLYVLSEVSGRLIDVLDLLPSQIEGNHLEMSWLDYSERRRC